MQIHRCMFTELYVFYSSGIIEEGLPGQTTVVWPGSPKAGINLSGVVFL